MYMTLYVFHRNIGQSMHRFSNIISNGLLSSKLDLSDLENGL